MYELPPNLREAFDVLAPKQREVLFSILQQSSDENDFFGKLAEHPELLAATLQGVASPQTDSSTELDAIVAELSQPVSNIQELPRRIEMFKRALAIIDREQNPLLWGSLQNDLALNLEESPYGDRAENLEQAIYHLEKALEVRTLDASPSAWALSKILLGRAYCERIVGERTRNLEEAIAHLTQALNVFTYEAYPAEWAMTQEQLGIAYTNRILGEPADNHEHAIGYYLQALNVYTRQEAPDAWAMIQNNIGILYADRIRGDRADNLEQAIDHYRQALAVYTLQVYPEQWAATQNNLGEAYRQCIRGERADNLERAIEHYHQALKVRTQRSYPEMWAVTQNNLSIVYQDRILGNREDNLEQALVHCQRALDVFSRQTHPEWWAMAQHTLASVYLYRFRGERSGNIESAITHSEHALKVYTQQAYPNRWALAQLNLATAFSDRICGERAENIERAIQHYQLALEVYTRQSYPEQWAMAQFNLAVTYQDRVLGVRASNLERAIEYYQQALQVKTQQQYPVDFQWIQRNLGHLYFNKKGWAEALIAYEAAICAEKVLLASAYTETGRRSEVAQTAGVYARAAYSLLKLGRAEEALAQLEQGKTRLLSHALALNEVDLSILPSEQQDTMRRLRQNLRELEVEVRLPSDTPARRDDRTLADALEKARAQLNDEIELIRKSQSDFLPEGLALEAILATIPSGAVLVAPVMTSQGSAVFVVPTGLHEVSLDHVVWVDDFKDAELQALLRGPAEASQWGGWLGAYFNARHDVPAWRDVIDETGRVLWERLIGPVHERLTSLGIQHILLMPQGGLGLLPLHAAWRETDGQRCYLLDNYTVTYVQSAYARHVSQERLSDTQRQARTLLAVVNPTEDLPFTEPEGEQVRQLFGEAHVSILPKAQATPEAVQQAKASYLHFACHGYYQWEDPMQSGLILANGKRLTLAEIIGHLDLDSTRLVTLSACETGITDIRQAPDEYLGLPAGFLQAGAPAVVSTLWAVNDLSTMLLMECFYQLHLKRGLAIAEALRQAQRWLRGVTAGELEERFVEDEEALLNQTALLNEARMSIEMVSEYVARFTDQDPEARPFAHPYYWAAFTLSGA